MDYFDKVYDSLIGQLDGDAAVANIPNAFAPGSPCYHAYTRLIQARNRVLDKLGTGDDPDLEQILTEMDTIQRALCRQIMAWQNL